MKKKHLVLSALLTGSLLVAANCMTAETVEVNGATRNNAEVTVTTVPKKGITKTTSKKDKAPIAKVKPTSTPVPTATPKPTATPTPQPTSTPVPTATPTPQPTSTPVPTATPTPKTIEIASVELLNSGNKYLNALSKVNQNIQIIDGHANVVELADLLTYGKDWSELTEEYAFSLFDELGDDPDLYLHFLTCDVLYLTLPNTRGDVFLMEDETIIYHWNDVGIFCDLLSLSDDGEIIHTVKRSGFDLFDKPETREELFRDYFTPEFVALLNDKPDQSFYITFDEYSSRAGDTYYLPMTITFHWVDNLGTGEHTYIDFIYHSFEEKYVAEDHLQYWEWNDIYSVAKKGYDGVSNAVNNHLDDFFAKYPLD